ncbi:hypothetical protein C8R47DRAFT_1143819 [Mycena vitilis]|nr:hypothetical protein C8R47DRAFT_1143819 [Mycena vitilis]
MVSKLEWTVSHLSCRFRDVVVGAPSLWKAVEASLDTVGATELLKLYLERSRACTLSLALHVGFKEFTQLHVDSESIRLNCDCVKKQLSQISSHFTRMWSLKLVLSSRLLLPPFRDIPVLNLQHLEVIMENHTDVGNSEEPEIFSSGPPTKLSVLKIKNWALPLPIPSWTASLTHLELWRDDSWTFSHNNGSLLVALTTQCAQLVHLHLAEDYVFSTAPRLHIPSLRTLRISVSDCEDEHYLLDIVDLFDTPALTEFIIDGTHGDQIFVLFTETSLPHTSFPALTSFSFINSGSCTCEDELPFANTISSPPLALFPALSSLTLINQCFAPKLVEDLLGPASQLWPQLHAITLCPKEDTLNGVCIALRDAADTKRQRRQTLPKLGLSSKLLSLEDWREKGVDVEKFHPGDILDLFQ